jgi:hypothetical protein
MTRKPERRAAPKTRAKSKQVRAKRTAATRKTAAKPPRETAKPAKPADPIDTLVTAGAEALKLPIAPAWRASVKFNLQLILRMAALVDEFPLPDDAEPAPVFHA